MDDLQMPDFLNEDADTIHERMLSKAPSDVNTIEGDFFYDTTRPTAEEIAATKQLQLAQIIRTALVQYSSKPYLDLIGNPLGIIRNAATYTHDTLEIQGVPGTVLQEGNTAGTVSTEDKESIEFEFQETKTIDDTGIVEIKTECTQAGSIGNVKAGSIVLIIPPINGIKSVTNDHDFTNGTDEEDDEHYRQRILEQMQAPATSGNKVQYKIWAKEVDGVGDAKVFPLWNGNGTVKVVIVNANKRAADQELVQKVKDYIDPQPEGHGEGQSPIGATLTVVSATEKAVNITAKVILANSYTIQQVQDNFTEVVGKYLSDIAFNSTYVSYAKIGSLLLSTAGIVDYDNLTLNTGTANVALQDEEIAVPGTISLGV
ncbi:baseplate J/gp47 family protein [Clostridium tyrobutyricum]|uniref:baseplate J/gp47 family protein n=1 Tax=Clostridium tyrobutyricum TaxID=1519 RepID=UPI00037BEF2B|nr:baseplate J/gp47 family protein [Clostridium tyrobutyricum]